MKTGFTFFELREKAEDKRIASLSNCKVC